MVEPKLPVVSKHSKVLDIIKKLSPLNATKEDLNYLYYMSKECDLDAIKKEIYLIFYNGKATVMISRDGYLKIANRNPAFDGIEGDAIYEGDILKRRSDGSLQIEYGANHFNFDKKLLRGAFCNVYRKDRDKAVSIVVSFVDYVKSTIPWQQYPGSMILKCAESMALKRAFAINGVIGEEELGVEAPKSNVVDTSIEILEQEVENDK